MPARSALTRHDLGEAGFHLKPGARLPLDVLLHGRDAPRTLGSVLDGKPALVVFTDYRCRSLCGVILDQLAHVVPDVPLKLGQDYNIVSLALDSTDTPDDAAHFRDAHTGGSTLHDAGLFFTNAAPALAALQASVGLVAPYDAEHKEFAHPAGLILVDAAGRAQRILSPFALNPFDLKLALTETGAPDASPASHALLLCYGWNPAAGLYTLRIERVLGIAAAVTIVVIAGTVGLFLLFERRRRTRVAPGTST